MTIKSINYFLKKKQVSSEKLFFLNRLYSTTYQYIYSYLVV